MARQITYGLILFLLPVLLQVLVFNNIMLFGVAAPIIFIYFIIRIGMNVPLNLLMTTSFLLGLTVDIFSDTPGMNALSCTLLSVLKRPILLAYCQHDDTLDEITPCCQTLGLWTYSKYALTMTLVYCIFYFGIEFFAIESIWQIALTALCSTMLSAILIVGIDSILLNHREKRL